jgi:hypothetical protein
MANGVYGRRIVIAAVGIVAAAAVHSARSEPQSASLPEPAATPGRVLGGARGELFPAPKAPAAKPKKAPAPVVVAPEPSAPKFPYRYGGWVNSGDGASHVFLTERIALVGIKPGEMLDAAWRLDAVIGNRIQVTFVPDGRQLWMSLASLMGGDAAAQSGTSSAHGEAFAGAAAAAGRSLTNVPSSVQPQVTATTDAARPTAASSELLAAGRLLPSAAPAPLQQPSPRPVTAAAPVQPATGATSSPMQPGAAPSGAMPSSPAPTGRLGIDAPSSGSMPTGPTQASGKKLGL